LILLQAAAALIAMHCSSCQTNLPHQLDEALDALLFVDFQQNPMLHDTVAVKNIRASKCSKPKFFQALPHAGDFVDFLHPG